MIERTRDVLIFSTAASLLLFVLFLAILDKSGALYMPNPDQIIENHALNLLATSQQLAAQIERHGGEVNETARVRLKQVSATVTGALNGESLDPADIYTRASK